MCFGGGELKSVRRCCLDGMQTRCAYWLVGFASCLACCCASTFHFNSCFLTSHRARRKPRAARGLGVGAGDSDVAVDDDRMLPRAAVIAAACVTGANSTQPTE